MSAIQAALSLYEQEVGRGLRRWVVPEKCNSWQVDEMIYTHPFGNFKALLMHTLNFFSFKNGQPLTILA